MNIAADELVNVDIRSHLIPFFFEEMVGFKASYDGQSVKMITLLPSSSLANYLYTQIEYDRKLKKRKLERFILYLSIEKKNHFTFTGQIYTDNDGVKSILKMTIDKVRELNNLLEDIFRTSMVFFIEGCKASKMEIRTAIEIFMEKYSLLEYGFEPETIRKMYYENSNENKTLNRFQQRSSNRTYGYM
jgi:hypothetical protein